MGKEFDWQGTKLSESNTFRHGGWNIFKTYENALTAAKKAGIDEKDIWHSGCFYIYKPCSN